MNARDALLSRACGQNWPFGPLLAALNLPATAAVLDIGAGEGELLKNLRRRGHTGPLVGLDVHPGPGVQSGGAEALLFADAHFDATLLVRTLLHVTNPQRAVAQAIRVLNPGGMLVVAAQGAAHLAGFWALFDPPAAESADTLTERLLVPWPCERLDLVIPAVLEPEMVRLLAASYDLPAVNVSAALPDRLHLAVFRLIC
ncbi:class I SAM-dependent methyltransferase [Deinococcus rubellus]|uniref:Methyltransferase domain-containing protein n=1 Tax=Deinococcus rubellus TaxID=1889240 RepID=A0ABY5YFS8_9DEIO|nr:methyltransferase domain-containing protein [Deinococcus rubellus]UWX63247.1 methyltransferase domain-containing protein [Deinococcus rubellus]